MKKIWSIFKGFGELLKESSPVINEDINKGNQFAYSLTAPNTYKEAIKYLQTRKILFL